MIIINTESGYKLQIKPDHTQVIKDGKTKRFIGKNHRTLAVDFIFKPQGN